MRRPRFLLWTTALVTAALGSLTATLVRLESRHRLDEIVRAAEHAEV